MSISRSAFDVKHGRLPSAALRSKFKTVSFLKSNWDSDFVIFSHLFGQWNAYRNSLVSEYGGGARVVWAMSADREEAAAKKGDDGSSSGDSRAAAALKRNWCVGLRIVELVCSVIAIGLVVGALYSPQVVQSDHRHIALIYSAYSSFIIITGVLIIARLLGEAAGWRTSLGFSAIGVIMFTAAAAVIFYDWHRSYYANIRPNKEAYDLLISSGVFAVINAAVFLVHAFLTFRKEAEY